MPQYRLGQHTHTHTHTTLKVAYYVESVSMEWAKKKSTFNQNSSKHKNEEKTTQILNWMWNYKMERVCECVCLVGYRDMLDAMHV